MDQGGSGEKTEQPTPKKIKDAKERGQVAKSKDLSSFGSIITILTSLCVVYTTFYANLDNSYLAVFQQISFNNINLDAIISIVFTILATFMKIVILIIIIAASISTLIVILQLQGIVINKEFFKFSLNRLNPVSNFKNIFSMKNLLKFLKQIITITIMITVALSITKQNLNDMVNVWNYSFKNILLFLFLVIVKIFAGLLLVYLIFAILDFVLEKRALNKQLMMSLEEIKREYKESEGDPEIKHQRREMHRELVEGDINDTIAESSFVLANPTHVAIVILFKPIKWPLPIVLFKAKNNNAQLIFRLAKKNNIPIIQDKWLARQLYKIAEVGKFIPQSLTADVAEIIGKNIKILSQIAKDLAEKSKTPAKPEIVAPVRPSKPKINYSNKMEI